jgi:hypothetical protein
MRTAVVRVNLDPAGQATAADLTAAVLRLRARGLEVRAPDLGRTREIQLITEGEDPAELQRWAQDACTAALGQATPRAGNPTFMSRGTDEDALGVVSAFGIQATIDRHYTADQEEVAVFTITRYDAGRVVESRLHTALEAALNCDVRIVVEEATS